ncbi:protein axin isoform X3 [Oratosquilla oratoria]|uniref:protein axin isoform X3 n=1 Tax=Oratosquilla oratoria TaxID=337810 RepID=UPI003F776269
MSSSPVVSTPGHEAQDPPRPSQGAQQTPAGVSSPTPPSQHFQGHCLGPVDPKGFLQGDWKDPRPPVPGGEDPYGEEKVDGRGGRHWGEKSSHHCLQYSPQLHPQFQVEGYEGCGCAEVGSPCEGWTPPCVRWSESLRQLLEDPIGVRMFQQYLKSECGSCESLHFWFACNGLKKAEDYSQLVTIIWKKFIRNYAVKVSPKTYTEINDKVNSKRNIDKNIFDKAQHEVEEEIARTTYPNFLESDIYLHHLSAQQTGGAESPKVLDSSPPIPSGGGVGVLPTLHEDFELQGGGHAEATHMRLTQGALAATVRQRANVDRRKTEACDGDGMPLGLGRPMNPKYMKRHYHKMRENARQNRELAMGGLMAHGGMGLLPGPSNSASIASNHPPSSGGHSFPFLPRTHRIRKESIPNMKPEEFALLLIEKLEMVKRDQEAQEKMQQSFKKIQEGDDVSDEYRRQHAFNSLPPALLLDKLVQKISIEETDKSQSILDEHVSRVWEDSNNESPARSPGTPRAKSPPRRVPPSCRSQHPNKGMVLGGLSHPSMYPGHHLHQPPNPYNTKTSSHHSRRKDRGPDVYSIFSSDSGNVPDFYDGHLLPKSRSMPDYMENYAGGSSDGGSSGRRQGSSSRRSGSRRPPAELTDSGVSVVSDSSMAPSASSTDRVTSWLMENDTKFSSSNIHGYPESDRDSKDSRMRSSRSTHTAAGSTSPGAGRRSSSKKGSSSSVMGTGPRSGSLERGHTSWGPTAPPGFEQREGGMHSASGCLYEDPKKKTRTGMSSHGGRTCHSGHGEGLPGSNGSTLKKSRAPRHSAPGSGISSSVGETSGSSSSCSQQIQQQGGQQSQQGSSSSSVVQSVAESTTIVYNFYDDSVPFVTKVPTRPITLKRFKQHLPKKGNYRFFFKKQCKEFGVIQEEITDDNEILPLYEGRVFAQVRKAD